MNHCASVRFPITIADFGAFLRRERGGLWRGIRTPPALEELLKALWGHLHLLRFDPPELPFVPNLTLAK